MADFARQKAKGIPKNALACIASRKARCRAAIKPRPSRMSPYAVWGAGALPLPARPVAERR